MADSGTIKVDMTKYIAPTMLMTVTLSGVKKWRIRLWIASLLFKLGALIVNCGVEITDRTKE